MIRQTSPTRRRFLAALPATALLAGSLLIAPLPDRADDAPIDGPQTSGDAVFPHVGNGGYDALDYDVSLAWSPTGTTTTPGGQTVIAGEITAATTTMIARALSPLRSFSLDFEGMEVSSVTVDGTPATWVRDIDEDAVKYKLVITPATPVDGEFTVAVSYSGPPVLHVDKDGAYEGWSGTNDGAILLGQPVGMMAGFPHNNTPSDKATYTISVDIPRTLANTSGVTGAAAVASNGELRSKDTTGDRTTWVWRQDKPMASDLAVIAIGRFDVIEGSVALSDGRSIPAWSFMDSGLSDANKTTIRNRVAQLETLTRNLETVYGAYPGNSTGVIVDAVPSGVNYALETQGRSFFPSAGSVNGNTLIHELVHQWYGNNVAPRDWTDIWIGEGMATWGPTHYNSTAGFGTGTSTEQAYFSSWSRTAESSLNWNIPPGAQTDSAELYGYQTYTRSAQFWEALKISLGDEAFFTLLKEWQTRYGGQSRTAADLKSLAEEISGRDITGLWNDWILEPGKPAWPDKLAVSLSALGDDPLEVGSRVTYRLDATNTGLVPLASSVVTLDLSELRERANIDRIPDGATIDGSTLTWTVPAGVDPGAVSGIVLTATVVDTAPGGPFSVAARVATLGGTCTSCVAEARVMDVLVPSTAPTVTGTATVGQTLTAVSEGWPEGTELRYSWAIDGEPVDLRGATDTGEAADTVTPADTEALASAAAPTSAKTVTEAQFMIPANAEGARITVTVTGTRAGWRDGSATSAPTAIVTAAENSGTENPGGENPGTPGGGSQTPNGQLSQTGAELPIATTLLALALLTAGGVIAARRRRDPVND